LNENPRGPGARAEDVADSDNIARGTSYKLFAVQIGSLICWVVALVVGEGKELFFFVIFYVLEKESKCCISGSHH